MRDAAILAAAALAAYLIVTKLGRPAATPAGVSDYARQVMEWQGWRYFSDGTVIGPDGSYFARDNSWTPVWSPAATYST